jgi:pimeloyl-ACP methyl ester carboxylesterase
VSIVPVRGVDLPEGRVVGAVEAGALDGRPVMLFHPTPSSCLFVRQHADAALRTGVRLLGFSRPGSAGSTMTSPGLRSVAEDAVRVADAFGLDRFAVLGYSGGTPFAAATAVVAPERVTALGLCAAVAPWREVTDRGAGYDDELVGLLTRSDGNLTALLDAVRGREEHRLAPMLALDDAELAARLLAEADPADAEWLTPELAMAQAITLQDTLSDDHGEPSYDSPAFDHVAFGGSWDVDVSAVHAPTRVWQGTLDPVTPPAHGEWWQRTVPHAELVLRDGCGHLGTFEAHRDEMLAVLRDAGGVTPTDR